jgi:hypothetical protein
MGPADGGVLEKIKTPIGPLAARAGTKIWIMHTLLSPDFFCQTLKYISIDMITQDFLNWFRIDCWTKKTYVHAILAHCKGLFN